MMQIKCRTILWYLVFTGMLAYTSMLANMNIAIITMVPGNNTTNSSISTNQTYFDWTEVQQGLILGSPYWFYCIVQLPAGVLTLKYGAKALFGLPNLFGGLLTFLVPAAAYHSFEILLMVRVLHGISAGMCMPAMHDIAARWIPPDERSHFLTTYLASALGIAVIYPTFGWIISVSCWENVFYLSGAITLIWYVAWYLFMFDTPAKHPMITIEERNYIEDALGDTVQENLSTPWRKLLTSTQVNLNCLAYFAYSFTFMMMLTYFPMYFTNVLQVSLETGTQLSGYPHLARFALCLVVGKVADRLIRRDLVPRHWVRRISTATSTLGAGILYCGLAYSSHSVVLSAVYVTAITLTSAFPNAGFFAAMVDIAPNFASVILALGTIAGGIAQSLTAVIVGWITDGNQSEEQWRKVFLVTAAILIPSGLLYLCYAETNVLEWNQSPTKLETEEGMVQDTQPNRKKRKRMESSSTAFGSIVF